MIVLVKASYFSLRHRTKFYEIYDENFQYTRKKKEISWETHCKWWSSIFLIEDLYLIQDDNIIIGYIRITKDTKEISMALKRAYQDKGYGSQAIELLEEKPKLAKVHATNGRSVHFFNKHGVPIEVI